MPTLAATILILAALAPVYPSERGALLDHLAACYQPPAHGTSWTNWRVRLDTDAAGMPTRAEILHPSPVPPLRPHRTTARALLDSLTGRCSPYPSHAISAVLVVNPQGRWTLVTIRRQ